MRSRILCLSFVAAPLLAQTPSYTAADYARAERALGQYTAPLVSGLGVRPTFTPDGRFWYRVSTVQGFQFVTVNPAKRSRASAFDQTRLAEALSAVMSGRIDPNRLPFQEFQLAKDGRSIVFEAGDHRWRCDLQAYRCASADSGAGSVAAPPNSIVSPDGRRAAFIRDYNLWITDLATGKETQLTTDGVRDFGYATNNAGWVRSPRPVLAWSPDSRRIATFQHDERGTGMMYLVSTNVGEPRLQAWHYPLPGDSLIFRVQRVIINVDTPSVVRFRMPPDEHRSTICDHISCNGDYTDVAWYPDASALAFASVSRDHKDVTLRIADAATGAVRDVLSEHVATQFESGIAPVGTVNWRILPASNEVLWWSQRSDWGHLYLYDLRTGRLKRQVTTGSWNVANVLRVDEKGRRIYVTGVGREAGSDPYFQRLYSVSLDNGAVRLLTPENANHDVTIAPDGRTFVDTYSTPVAPPVTVLRDANGRLLLTLERADASRLLATGWRPPTPIVVKARDGETDLYGLMFTPSRLDSARKYPIINHIYPGPQTGSVATRDFSPARGDDQALAELGFVVVEIDGMGTPWRSKSFQDFYYGRMGDNTLPDQVAGMRELAGRYPFIDVGRAAIWGHSGGGFAAADAMFRYPDFFKVGIAESGNHDNRDYEDDWGERYQGLLVRHGSSDNYAAEANQPLARNLKGKLLLAHGGVDDNVPPYNTYLVVDELIKANKDFDLLVLPNQRHGYGSQANYMMRRRWDYFVRNLLGAEPPKEYEIGRPGMP